MDTLYPDVPPDAPNRRYPYDPGYNKFESFLLTSSLNDFVEQPNEYLDGLELKFS